MKSSDIVKQLKSLGSDSYRNTLLRHGAKDPVLGVKISELKKFQKQIKQDYQLSLELFDTEIYDAQYLAGLIADDQRMTKRDLRHWLAVGNSYILCGSIVAWVAAESQHGHELALKWIDAKNDNSAQTGWMTLCSLVAITADDDLDLPQLKRLLKRVGSTIHDQPDRVRYAMNAYVIAVGSYVSQLTDEAIKIAKNMGTVSVDMGETACEVPAAVAYIQKVKKRGAIGKKRKSAKC